MGKQTLTPKLENFGSLITYKDADGKDCCLGDLMVFEGHGTYDLKYGRVEVTKEQAETHNRLLSNAMLKGMDENCKVGQGGGFYVTGEPEKVTTFNGTVVSEDVTRKGRVVKFVRNGKHFRGIARKNADYIFFKRVVP